MWCARAILRALRRAEHRRHRLAGQAQGGGDRSLAQTAGMEGVDRVIARVATGVAQRALKRGTGCGVRRRRRGRYGDGGIDGSRGGPRRRAYRGLAAIDQAFDDLAEVLDQVAPVGHLDSLWGTLPPAVGVGPAPVAGDDLHARVRA